MFQLKKILGALLMPHTVFLALLGMGVLMLWFSSKRRLAQTIVTIAALGFFLLSYSGWWNFLVDRMEYQYPVLDSNRKDLEAIHWIVVFGGGGVKGESLPANSQLSPAGLARLTEGIRISRIIP